MKSFIKTEVNGTTGLINPDHIRRVYIDDIRQENGYLQTWRVVAELSHGTDTLYKGKRDECEWYVRTLARQIGYFDPTEEEAVWA